ncbi:nuclear transport factor 2 family protein [Sinorhizobium sp. RAC02]|uniref:nuclear transport factor 2 family protein n=1 Tax=Sinorhizobium sp. RAC02 TaxID=1842534 RepID=UPI00083D8A8A|nr:nuclear transport factor 2 family protein [Sinorhizobium sp. RAC02]AOF88466.1 snoaL-like domain protein [Sinorhizobium sp. RAC02]
MQQRKALDGVAIQNAIEKRDGHALAEFYAENAVLKIIDRNNPPSRPRELAGKAVISEFWNDVCGREMEHKVDAVVTEGSRISLTETCAYPDGTRVFCAAMIDVEGGKIARQTVIQAWDE